MLGVLDGFAVIGAVIAVGFTLAHTGVLTSEAQTLLARISFTVATPALLFQLLSRTEIADVVSLSLAVTTLCIAIVASLYAVAARWWRRGLGPGVVGALCSAYVNAGNLGLPIAVYVLGDGTAVAPLIVLQLSVVTPLALALLDASARREGGDRPAFWSAAARTVTTPLRNPVTVACFVGLLWAVTGWTAPTAVTGSLDLIAAMAIPSVLLAYGVSLRLGPRPIAGGDVVELGVVCGLKLVVHPGLAYLLGRAFGLSGHALLAVVVVAALPTAQNIFVYATRYGQATVLARDSIFVTTILSVPALLVTAALLG
ncbi:MAG TPA: AEC family transporter [Dermatophilaceae bacterium]|nr:AEC family transporter [Dermatophilaceae bacterium]